MTSNVGGRDMNVTPIGFGSRTAATPKNAIEKMFSPEFRNRLDAVINFNPLDETIMLQVVDKFLRELANQLADQDVIVKVSSAVRKELARRGYDPLFGARPLGRLIQTELSDPLAEKILFGELRGGGEVKVGSKAGKLVFRFQ
jgi:ATP-dependent Clp protease ATP-binding subunit ClpA